MKETESIMGIVREPEHKVWAAPAVGVKTKVPPGVGGRMKDLNGYSAPWCSYETDLRMKAAILWEYSSSKHLQCPWSIFCGYERVITCIK